MFKLKDVVMDTKLLSNDLAHFEHTQWSKELSFWKDELRYFNEKLSEIVTKWTDKSVMAELEQFQNQFIRQTEVVDTLQHEINVHETEISSNLKKGVDVLHIEHAKNHKAFQEKMETQRNIYTDMKKKFFAFLSKYM